MPQQKLFCGKNRVKVRDGHLNILRTAHKLRLIAEIINHLCLVYEIKSPSQAVNGVVELERLSDRAEGESGLFLLKKLSL